MKVLVIDDEEDLRYIARLSLERLAGMTVIESASGQGGLALARSEHPDCILLDVMMPDMDGEATLAALRADPETAGIPVVFLTAIALTPEVKRMTAMGARGVIRKPFDPKTLAQSLRELIA
jgi:two-component system alkaline phosphatase synthesis response regulator PhoP